MIEIIYLTITGIALCMTIVTCGMKHQLANGYDEEDWILRALIGSIVVMAWPFIIVVALFISPFVLLFIFGKFLAACINLE